MGMNTITFKCPYCDNSMGQAIGPNWTAVGPQASTGVPVVLSCTKCNRALGAYFETSRPPR
jgi:hypothetical protein